MTAPAYRTYSWSAWRPNRALARAAAILFVLSAVLTPVTLWGLLRMRDALVARRRGSIDPDRLDTVTRQYLAINGVAGLLSVAALVVVIVLTWRLAKNHQLIGRPGTRLAPGWAIAGWLVPIVQWIVPFVMLGELWKGAHPDDAPRTTTWRERPSANVISLWWALTIAVAIASTIGSAEMVSGLFRAVREVGSGDDLTDVAEQLVGTALRWQVAALLLGALTNVVAAVAVTMLAERQDAYADRWRLRSEAGGALVTVDGTWAPVQAATPWGAGTGATPPGWYPDPSGRHQHRWWDGWSWTPHVADDGRTSTD